MTEITTRTPNARGEALLNAAEQTLGVHLWNTGEPGIAKPSVNLDWKVTRRETGWTAVTEKFRDSAGNGLRLVVVDGKFGKCSAMAFGKSGMITPPGYCGGSTPDEALEHLRQKLAAEGYAARKP